MTLDRVEVAGVVEIESHRYAHSGSDDYTREITRIVTVVDATGRAHMPVPGEAWTSIVPGIDTVRRDGHTCVRIAAAACPALVQFEDISEYGSYSDRSAFDRSTELRWTAYLRPGTSLWTRLVVHLRWRRAERRGRPPRRGFWRQLHDLGRD